MQVKNMLRKKKRNKRRTGFKKYLRRKLVSNFRPIAIPFAPAKLFDFILHCSIYSGHRGQLCDEQHSHRTFGRHEPLTSFRPSWPQFQLRISTTVFRLLKLHISTTKKHLVVYITLFGLTTLASQASLSYYVSFLRILRIDDNKCEWGS